MSSRFLRENSQIIASFIITGYIGANYLYKVNKADFWKTNYELKNSQNVPIILSIKEEEDTLKFLYRLNDTDGKFRFFRTNSMDFVSFGYNGLRQGCDIGLPASYFANSKKELMELSPKNGYENFLGQRVLFSELNDKLSKEKLDDFYTTLLLSKDAKSFGLAHAIAETNHFKTSSLDWITDFICLSGAYMFSYVRSRQFKMQLRQRRRLYLFSTIVALCSATTARFFIKPYNEKIDDKMACKMGLDCCEGSIEYYDKMIERNKILRDAIENGHYLIDSDGNLLKQLIRIPFVETCIYINNFGLKLTDRREFCQKELNRMVFKLIQENDELAKKNNIQNNEAENEHENSKEWKFFRDLRLSLEKITNKNTNTSINNNNDNKP